MLIGKMEVNMQELWIKNLKEVLGNHERRMERQIIIWGHRLKVIGSFRCWKTGDCLSPVT